MKKTNHKKALQVLKDSLTDEAHNDNGEWRKLKKDLENTYTDEHSKVLCLGEVINNLLDKIDILRYELSHANGLVNEKQFNKLLKAHQKKRKKYTNAELSYYMTTLLSSLPDHGRLDSMTVGHMLCADYKTGKRALFLMAKKMKEGK